MDLINLSLSEISNLVKSKKASAKEVAQTYFERAKKIDTKLNSVITWNENYSTEAVNIDARIAKGEEVGKLAGVPFGIKDMFCTKGLRTTAGSKILENFIPPYDSTVVAKLKQNGITILGKLNQDEFAMGSSNETSYFGNVKNPWNLDFVPGGSSGGSAAAQAARLMAATVGTDTGGSIRQPASFCGIVGIKPTYGRVSRYGIVSYASSLDQAGPMVTSVADAALVTEVLCGQDPRDMTTSNHMVPDFSKLIDKNMKGVKIGLVKEYTKPGVLEASVEKALNTAIESLKKQGAEFIDVSIPLTEYAVPIYYLIAASEASSNLARYDGVKYGHRPEFKNLSEMSLDDFYGQTRSEGFGTEVKRRIMLGTYCLSSGYFDAYYNKACQVRRLLRGQFLDAFSKCDVLLSPVSTTPAFKIGDRISDPLAMYLNDIYTVSTNLAGLPGMSVPFSQSDSGASNGLPIGLQLTAAHFQEQKLFNVGAALEEAGSWNKKVANV